MAAAGASPAKAYAVADPEVRREARPLDFSDKAISVGALARRPEGEDRDLGPAVESEPRVRPEAAVSVQEHLTHAVEPSRGLAGE